LWSVFQSKTYDIESNSRKSDLSKSVISCQTSGPNTSIKNSYIVFFTKMQKRQSPKMRFAFLISENTTSRFLTKKKIYCSEQRISLFPCTLEIYEIVI